MSTPITLSFLGGTETVTGSKFLLESGGRRVLVDCGLFQGVRDVRRRNWERLPVPATSIDAVVLTHAHLDHCGFLPVLARDGFTGPIMCTADTARLVEIVLRDAAHLQEDEAQWARRTGLSRHEQPRPLFDSADAERAIALLMPTPRHQPTGLGNGFTVELYRAGHILGSCFAVVSHGETRLAFSGDLGRLDHPLLRPPEALGPVDHVIVESTYGDRRHEGHGADDLADVLSRTLGRGGVALLPAFAVDRTPMLLHEIQGLMTAGRVPAVPVYVDSPMALAALDVYREALGAADSDFRDELTGGPDPFSPSRLRLVHGAVESEKLNDPHHPCVIVSASGMASGGRVVHHLAKQLPVSRNTIVLTGYQVAGTRGRELADGVRQVKIRGRYVPVRAEIANLRGFSAHADADGLLDWLSTAPEPRSVYVVHGESASSAALAERIRSKLGWTAVVPELFERVRVD